MPTERGEKRCPHPAGASAIPSTRSRGSPSFQSLAFSLMHQDQRACVFGTPYLEAKHRLCGHKEFLLA